MSSLRLPFPIMPPDLQSPSHFSKYGVGGLHCVTSDLSEITDSVKEPGTLAFRYSDRTLWVWTDSGWENFKISKGLISAEVVSQRPSPTEQDPERVESGTWLKFTWDNSDSTGSTEVTYVDISRLVDMYVTETTDSTLVITSTGNIDAETKASTKLIRISDIYKNKINEAATNSDLLLEISNRQEAIINLRTELKGNSETDSSSTLTLEGVKKYADQQATAARDAAYVYSDNSIADALSWSER